MSSFQLFNISKINVFAHWHTLIKGQKGEEFKCMIELKRIADVGLIGYPNAGKSTLLRALSNAQPQISAEPFTTVRPNIGHIGRQNVFLKISGQKFPKNSQKNVQNMIRFGRGEKMDRTRLMPNFCKNFDLLNDCLNDEFNIVLKRSNTEICKHSSFFLIIDENVF